MADEDVKFAVGAEDTGVEAVMAQVQETITASIESIKGSIESISGAFDKVNEAFLAFTAVLGGGEAFKEAIDTTVNMTVESVALGHQLGISATEASQLKVSLASVFVTQDQYASAAAKITMALKKNEGAFNSAGVATRDSNGALLSTQEIMQNVTAHLQGFTEGQNRNVEAAKLLGKGWLDFIPVMRATGQVIEEGAAKADALGLTVGVEGAAAVAKYRTAMNDVHEVIEAVENVIGQALMPTLTKIGEWFGEVGPEVVTGFRAAFNVLGTVFTAVAGVMQSGWELEKVVMDLMGAAFEGVTQFVMGFYGAIFGIVPGVKDSISTMFGGPSLSAMQVFGNMIKVVEVAFIILSGEIQGFVQIVAIELEGAMNVFKMFGQVADRAFHLDWAGVKTAWSGGLATLEADAKARLKAIADIAAETGKKVQSAIMGDPGAAGPNTPTAKPPPANPEKPTPDKDKSEMAAMETELAEFKANMAEKLAAQGDFQEFSKQMDKDYWLAILAQGNLSAKDQVAVRKKIADDTIGIAKQDLEGQLTSLKTQESAATGNFAVQLALEQAYLAKVKQAYGEDSKEYAAAQKDILATKRAAVEQQNKLDDIRTTSVRNAQVAQIGLEQEAAKTRNELGLTSTAEYIAQEIAFENRLYAIREQALQDQLKLALLDPYKNAVQIAQLNAQVEVLESQHQTALAKIRTQANAQAIALYKSFETTFQNGMATAFQNVINGTQTVGKAFESMFTGMLSAVVSSLAKMAAQWVAQHALQMLLGTQERASNSATAATGAGASAAAIPVIGWALAPIEMAATFAAASAYSAAQGYDVPASINPITQLHAKEMVLPAKHADVIRAMADGGGPGPGGSGGGGANHLHVSALDGHSVQKVLTRNATHVTKAMKKINARFMK